jgi:hypothetical protein
LNGTQIGLLWRARPVDPRRPPEYQMTAGRPELITSPHLCGDRVGEGRFELTPAPASPRTADHSRRAGFLAVSLAEHH